MVNESGWNASLGHSGQESSSLTGAGLASSGAAGSSGSGRQALHGELLAFSHPWTREPLEVADPWPEDMLRLHKQLGGAPQV
ncbi:hypothetical protein D3C75_911160 [compost metagenome]